MRKIAAVFYSSLVIMATTQQLTEKYGTKSAVWKHFGLLTDDRGLGIQQDNSVCRICRVQVRATTGNTSNLLPHLKNKHPMVHKELRLQMNKAAGEKQSRPADSRHQPTLSSVISATQLYERSGKRWAELTDSITNWIAQDGLPIYVVEKNGFKKMMAAFDKRYEIPSRNYFSRTGIPALYETTRERVSKEVLSAEYFSATTDMWSSVGMKPYLSFPVHFVDCDWKLHSRCLLTAFMPEDHTADNLSAALSDVLDAWQLSSAKQVAITTDNGSNIVLACSNLDWLRLSCFGHNLNLAVRKSVSDSRCVRALAVCKKIVSAFSMSWKKRRDLIHAQKELKLRQKCLVSVSYKNIY